MKYLLAVLFGALTIISCASNFKTAGDDDYCPNLTDGGDSACFKSTLITVYAEDSYPKAQRTDLATALTDWSNKTNQRVRFDLIFVPKSMLKEEADLINTYFVFYRAPSNPKFAGYCTWEERVGAFLEIKPGLPEDIVEPIALHEFGHALGLKHYTGTEPSIMHPELKNGFEISCLDLKNFCDIWGCSDALCDKKDASN